jgi:hypothetical protein
VRNRRRSRARLTGLVTACLTGLALVSCAMNPPGAGTPTASVPTTQQQGAVAEAFIAETMRASPVEWGPSQDNSWTQDCVLEGGSRGALVNVTRIGGGVADPRGTQQLIGAAWEADGLDVRYSTSAYNDGSPQYVVSGTGGRIASVQFGAGSHRSTIAAVSRCGVGDAAELG